MPAFEHQIRWQLDLDMPPVISHVLDGNQLILGTFTGGQHPRVVGVDRISGERTFSQDTPGVVPNHLVSFGRKVVLVSADDHRAVLHVLDPVQGTLRRFVETPGRALSLRSIGETLYVVTTRGVYEIARARSGWGIARKCEAEIRTVPTVANGTVYYTTVTNTTTSTHEVVALSLATMAPLWRRTINGPSYSNAAADQDALYLGTGDHADTIYAIDLRTGKDLWKSEPLHAPIAGDIAVGKARVFVASQDNAIRILDRKTGRLLDHLQQDGEIGTRLVVNPADDVLYATGGQRVYAYAADSDAELALDVGSSPVALTTAGRTVYASGGGSSTRPTSHKRSISTRPSRTSCRTSSWMALRRRTARA